MTTGTLLDNPIMRYATDEDRARRTVATEQWFPSRRSSVAHTFIAGAGTFDTALCGAVLHPDGQPSLHQGDRRCGRCAHPASLPVAS